MGNITSQSPPQIAVKSIDTLVPPKQQPNHAKWSTSQHTFSSPSVVTPPHPNPTSRKRRRRSPTRIWVSVFSTKRTKYFFTDDTRLSILHDKWSGLLGGVVRALQGICMSWEMGRIDSLL